MKHRIVAFLLIFLIPTYLQAQKTATLIYIDQYKDIAIKEMKSGHKVKHKKSDQ